MSTDVGQATGAANGVRGRRISVQPLTDARRERVKVGFAVRRVPREAMQTILAGTMRPRTGDVVLARISRLGQHRKLEQPDGRRAALHIGDEIIVTYADRYAPDQFEAHVPPDLGRTQLVASGGIASQMLTRSSGVRNATDIEPVGLVGDAHGRPLNVADFGLPAVPARDERPRTVAVIGTSMNSGKTTTIHFMVHGLTRAGVRAGVTKVTGTGSGADYWVMLDAGAHRMLDFTDVGLASTYRQPMIRVEQAFVELVDHLADAGSQVAFVEVADGIYQRETAKLIESEIFAATVDAVVFAAADSSGAVAGVHHLRSRGLDVVAVSGRITRSPLAVREAEQVLGLPVLDLDQLSDPVSTTAVLGLSPELLPIGAEPWMRRPSPVPRPASSAEEAPAGDELLPEDEAVVPVVEQR
ncbi:MAG: DUF1611 domain-containing protein [Pseudonocardia sp.]